MLCLPPKTSPRTRIALWLPILMVWWSCSAAIPCQALELTPDQSATELDQWSLSQLEKRLAEIDDRLGSLAKMSLRTGEGTIGYRSGSHEEADANEWIEIDLKQEYRIDQLVLIPVTLRDFQKGYIPDAFPQKFRIRAGTKSDPKGKVIAEYDATSRSAIGVGIAPVFVPIKPTLASWVRVEATLLSMRAFDERYALELSELLVFSGNQNVALNKKVQSPVTPLSHHKRLSASWAKTYLVDGSLPYLMNSASGGKSISYLSKPITKPTKGGSSDSVFTLDLKETYPLSQINIHTIDGGNTVPHSNTDGVGTPDTFRIEGANQSDFSDATLLVQYTKSITSPDSPIMMWNIPTTNCRYVRLTAPQVSDQWDEYQIGFAEIELIANGENAALGKQFSSNTKPMIASGGRSIEALTDGKNPFGNVLPQREWLEQLAERHQLEIERPSILAEIARRHAKQKSTLRIMSWMLAIAIVAICFTILIGRNIRAKQAAQIKERFAADLHDELGANLHTISLLSELAKNSVDSRDELVELLDEMSVMSERSGKAARYCTNILEAEELCQDLKEEIERVSRRLLSDIKYQLNFEGREELSSLRTSRRIDLFLFFKESLINIIRHSRATEVVIDVSASKNDVKFVIQDNGIGTTKTPPSLARRAKLLKAKLSTSTPDEGGTSITLTLKRT